MACNLQNWLFSLGVIPEIHRSSIMGVRISFCVPAGEPSLPGHTTTQSPVCLLKGILVVSSVGLSYKAAINICAWVFV